LKTNIQQVKYNDKSDVPDKCVWYSWDEVCDNCGNVIHKFKDFITTGVPNDAEDDYCLPCLRVLLDKELI